MTDKEIIYFIMSHSIDPPDKPCCFIWPCLPDPKMGDDFCNKIKKDFEEVELWIKANPERFKSAQNGYYTE